MPEIKQATRKTENPYVNLYELETKDRVESFKSSAVFALEAT